MADVSDAAASSSAAPEEDAQPVTIISWGSGSAPSIPSVDGLEDENEVFLIHNPTFW